MKHVTTPQALLDYEQRLRALAAPVVNRLRPGLSDADLDAIEDEHAFPLPPMARALWGWHDGAELAADRARRTSLVPGGIFRDLRASFALTQQWQDIASGVDPVLSADLVWQPRWLVAIDDQYPTVLDCTHTASHKTPALRYAPDSGVLEAFQLHLERWVETWTWAVDHHVWTLDDEGAWVVHRDRRPDGPVSLMLM